MPSALKSPMPTRVNWLVFAGRVTELVGVVPFMSHTFVSSAPSLRHTRSRLPSPGELKSLLIVSSSTTFTVAVIVAPSFAPTGEESVAVKLCIPSMALVLMSGTSTVFDVSPPAKFTVTFVVV